VDDRAPNRLAANRLVPRPRHLTAPSQAP